MRRKIFIALGVWMWCLFVAAPAFAQDPNPPPDPITQIFQYVIQFPTDSLVEALTQALQAILTKSIEPLEQVFSASLARWVTTSPSILTPGGGIVSGVDIMVPTWNLTSRIAILLWPLTLAITAVVAAKDVVTAGQWGIGDLKQALGTWLVAVIASATSLYWMDLANRFANATTAALLNLSFFGAGGFNPNLLTGILLGTAVTVLGMTGLGLVVAIIVIVVGVSILASLIFQFLARYALLYVLVALAPVVIMLGVLPPLRWLTRMWLNGFVWVLVIGPINALLLKLVLLLGERGLSNDPLTAFVDFMAAAGVLSALLAINYTLIRFVFGAMGQVMQRAVGTVAAVGTLALAAVGGAAAAGAIGAAGSGTSGAATGGSAMQGLGNLLRNPRAMTAGMETAGSVLARSGGMGRGVGAALWGIGSAMRQGQFANGNSANGAGSGSTRATNAPSQNGPNGSAPTFSGNGNASQASPNTFASFSPANNPNSSNANTPSPSSPPTQSATGGVVSQVSPPNPTNAASPSTTQPNATNAPTSPTNPTQGTPNPSAANTPTTNARSAAQNIAANTGNTSAMVPANLNTAMASSPAQPPISNLSGTRTSIQSSIANPSVVRETNALTDLLDAPLGERVRELTAAYEGNSSEQIQSAQGAVAALSALEAHHNVEPQLLASSWDQTMGPVLASAREGLALETMAQDAGYRGDVTQFIGARVEAGLMAAKPEITTPLFPRVEAPTVAPWHPQVSPHDVQVGGQMATLLGAPPQESMSYARMYHAVRSPESGGGWQAGMEMRQAAQQVTSIEPTKRLGAFDARLQAMERQGAVPSNALRLWRIHLQRRTLGKG